MFADCDEAGHTSYPPREPIIRIEVKSPDTDAVGVTGDAREAESLEPERRRDDERLADHDDADHHADQLRADSCSVEQPSVE